MGQLLLALIIIGIVSTGKWVLRMWHRKKFCESNRALCRALVAAGFYDFKKNLYFKEDSSEYDKHRFKDGYFSFGGEMSQQEIKRILNVLDEYYICSPDYYYEHKVVDGIRKSTKIITRIFLHEKKRRPSKKILFLDFDGVMVTDRYQEQLTATNSPLRDEYGAKFDPVCMENLCHIIYRTDVRIVVTSTWKMNLGLEGLQQMWDARGLPGMVVGVTPDINPTHRGDEIQAWLDDNPNAVRYAIIDDCPILNFFREEQLPFLIKVDERTGLDEDCARRVVELLK